MPTFLLRRVGKVNTARMNSSWFAQEITNTLHQEAMETKRLYEATTATWVQHPDFQIRLWGGFNADIGTSDPVYNFLDFGTSVRYAHMSNDFQPKTIPGFVGSVPGAGRAVARGYAAQAHQGIEARRFSETITEIMRPLYRQAMANAVKRAVRAMKGT